MNPTNHLQLNKRELFRLTWPIFLEAALFSLIGSIDVIMLSRYCDNAVGAVGIADQFLFFFRVLTTIITSGTGILCAQYIGAGKTQDEKQPLVLGALMVNGCIGLLFSICLMAFAEPLLGLMSVSPELMVHAKPYLTIVGAGLLVQTLTMTFTTLIRSHGQTAATMGFSIVMNLVNLVLNYLLIYGRLGLPALGATGAAIATVAGQTVNCILSAALLLRRILPGMSLRPDWTATGGAIRQVLTYGLPAAGEKISYTLSNLMVMAIVTSLGTVAVNTYSYLNSITRYVYLFSNALGQATAILIGWAVGRREPQQADRICRFSARASLLVALGVLTVLALLRRQVLGLFTDDVQIIQLGAAVILSNYLLEWGRSRNLIFVNALRAAGDVRFPMYMGLFSMWFFSVGVSWLLGVRLGAGLIGVWIGLGLDESFRAVAMQLRWKNGRWMHGKNCQ